MFQLCLTLGQLYYIYSFEMDCKNIITTTEKNTEDGKEYWWMLVDLKDFVMAIIRHSQMCAPTLLKG